MTGSFAALRMSLPGPSSPFRGRAEHGSSARVLQTSIFSAISMASSRYRTVRSIFEWPNKSCTARKLEAGLDEARPAPDHETNRVSRTRNRQFIEESRHRIRSVRRLGHDFDCCRAVRSACAPGRTRSQVCRRYRSTMARQNKTEQEALLPMRRPASHSETNKRAAKPAQPQHPLCSRRANAQSLPEQVQGVDSKRTCAKYFPTW